MRIAQADSGFALGSPAAAPLNSEVLTLYTARWVCSVSSLSWNIPAPHKLPVTRKNPEFQVDFYEYPKEDAIITFHFPVYTNNVVVMNSIQKGSWNEKNIAFSGSIVTGKSFEL
nr:galectin-10 isoform X3 [Symphalangus syndactylus]XP_055103930.1 galectin-10 isoform X3 [Symphalangus syndactylus]